MSPQQTKILLINPGQYMPANINYPLNAFQPLGIGYIAKVLLNNGYVVKILDVSAEGFDHEEILEKGMYRYAGLPEKEIKKRIKKFSPHIVGITIPFTVQAKSGHKTAELVKKISKTIPVIVGGAYPTAYADTILEDKNIDFAVVGEGELTFLELVSKIGQKCGFSSIKGLAYRKNSKTVITKPRQPLTDLDNYSMAWELLPMNKYFEAANKIKSARSISTFGKKWATIFTSRGCPFQCSFCAGHLVMGRIWRPRSVNNVIEEMAFLIEKYHIEHFDIEDDNFTLNKARAKLICDKIIEKGWRIEWSTPNGIRADTVDEELIRKMKAAGCVRTIVAPESGSQWVLDNLMNKKLDLTKVKNVVGWCRKYGLLVDAFFLIGMPGEKKAQIEKTIKFAHELRRLGANDCGFSVLVPHRGTGAFNTALANNWLLKSYTENPVYGLNLGEPMIETPYLSIHDVKNYFKIARKVNPIIPYGKLRLAAMMMIRSPKRFTKLTISYLLKHIGISEGILGT